MQHQYVEKPYKVLAEPFDPTADPVQAGVCTCPINPGRWDDGRPHVHTARGTLELAAGDWIVKDLWRDVWDLIPDAEFVERFGGTGPPAGEA